MTSSCTFVTRDSGRFNNNNQYDRDRDRGRPQVDEFGNPLEDIHSVDTTRFELGTGVEADEIKCPRNWVPRRGFLGSCYKFTRSVVASCQVVASCEQLFYLCAQEPHFPMGLLVTKVQ